MKYFKSAFRYFWDKGPYAMLISLVPSLLLPFLISPASTPYYLVDYQTIDYSSFASLYVQMHELPYEYWYIGLIGVVLMVVCLAILFGAIDRHMRVGEFSVSFTRAKVRLNYNLLTALKLVVFMLISLEINNIIITALYYLWAVLFGRGATWLVFSIISFLLMSLWLLFVYSAILLWAPFMLHTGMKSTDAFRMAWRQLSNKVLQIMISFIIVASPFIITMIITESLNCGALCRSILEGLLNTAIVPFYVILMYVIFYDVTGTERMDLSKKDIWSKKNRH